MTRLKRQVLLQVAAAAALAVLAVGARAADGGPISVSGKQLVVNENQGSYKMTGTLLGSWNITKFVPRFQSAKQFVGTGAERFVGCVDANHSGACDTGDPSGTLSLVFTYWTALKNGKPTTGACVHPIVGGTKDFAKAKGIIFMKDTPVGKTIRTTYRGTIDLGSSRALSSSSGSSPC